MYGRQGGQEERSFWRESAGLSRSNRILHIGAGGIVAEAVQKMTDSERFRVKESLAAHFRGQKHDRGGQFTHVDTLNYA